MTENPNVLLITTDHWPGALLGCAGHPKIQTPTLDELARCGTRFSSAYSECPVCVPARRTLMTGTSPRTHGDRVFDGLAPMPAFPTLAQTFRDSGYQAFAAGKLHVYPPRNRIGFDDVMLCEEGRVVDGMVDDYEIFLGENGHVGQQFLHGLGNNQYVSRPWHLDEYLHPTNWITNQMAHYIRRRDPTRPAFWYLSYTHPHPPLAPLQAYLDLYRDVEIDEPCCGEWAEEPPAATQIFGAEPFYNEDIQRAARRAFYALCTQIDHQLRVVIGTLREERILDNTIILFTSDHGDMLGHHGLWRKRLFYEYAAGVPMILLGVKGDERVAKNAIDDRLVGLCDVMPTLLDLSGVPIPPSVEGQSLCGTERRDYFYGEVGEDATATRMMRDARFKLIYYPGGNRLQLFDLENDPHELCDLSAQSQYFDVRARLTHQLIAHFYGSDKAWLQGDELVGLPAPVRSVGGRDLFSQRGLHWPPPKY